MKYCPWWEVKRACFSLPSPAHVALPTRCPCQPGKQHAAARAAFASCHLASFENVKNKQQPRKHVWNNFFFFFFFFNFLSEAAPNSRTMHKMEKAALRFVVQGNGKILAQRRMVSPPRQCSGNGPLWLKHHQLHPSNLTSEFCRSQTNCTVIPYLVLLVLKIDDILICLLHHGAAKLNEGWWCSFCFPVKTMQNKKKKIRLLSMCGCSSLTKKCQICG